MDRRAAAADLDRDRGPAARPLARLVQHQHRADPDEQLPQRRRIGPRPGAAQRVVPGRSQRPGLRDRPRPGEGAGGRAGARQPGLGRGRPPRRHRAAGPADRRHPRRRSLRDLDLRRDPETARRRQGSGRQRRADRRPDGDRTRPPRRRRPRLEADPARRPRGRPADPDRPAPLAGRAADPDRDRDPLVRRRARRRLRRLRRHLRLRRQRPLAAPLRVHLPRRARSRLQHLPDGARAGGDEAEQSARGSAARPRRDRRRDHLGRDRPRRHLLDPGGAAARLPHRARLRRRLRGAPRHLRRPLDPRAGAGDRSRRPDLVAVRPGLAGRRADGTER